MTRDELRVLACLLPVVAGVIVGWVWLVLS